MRWRMMRKELCKRTRSLCSHLRVHRLSPVDIIGFLFLQLSPLVVIYPRPCADSPGPAEGGGAARNRPAWRNVPAPTPAVSTQGYYAPSYPVFEESPQCYDHRWGVEKRAQPDSSRRGSVRLAEVVRPSQASCAAHLYRRGSTAPLGVSRIS